LQIQKVAVQLAAVIRLRSLLAVNSPGQTVCVNCRVKPSSALQIGASSLDKSVRRVRPPILETRSFGYSTGSTWKDAIVQQWSEMQELYAKSCLGESTFKSGKAPRHAACSELVNPKGLLPD
jgi:hypothetical protein